MTDSDGGPDDQGDGDRGNGPEWMDEGGNPGDATGGPDWGSTGDEGGDAGDPGNATGGESTPGGGSAGDGGGDWTPDDASAEATFEGDGTSGGAAEVVEESGEYLTEDYWFEGEHKLTTSQGTPMLYALSAAGLYASSFIFAAVGVAFIAPLAAQTYIDLVLNAVFFFTIPIAAFLSAGLAIEAYLYLGDGDVPETTLPLALLVPVLLHVSLFFVEFVELGYTQATLAELFAENPTFAQLLLWPPVIMGTIFSVIVYRTTVAERTREDDSGGPFEFV